MKRLGKLGAVLGATLVAAAPARAQEIEVPILVIEQPETDTGESDDELDLANLVQTAAKGVTTVQEAPAIITIIPEEEIRDRGLRNLEETLDLVPGWMRYGAEYSQFPFVNTRGMVQAMLFMRDGVSMFDPTVNVATVSRVFPLETVKRIEAVTGPGGVLWGANSFLGVVNVITKDAEDVNGVEASVGGGHGDGDAENFRGYVMYGNADLMDGKMKVFAHASFDTWKGALWEMPYHLYSSPTPQPNSPDFYGPMTTADPKRSIAFNFDGKLTFGPLNLYYSIPYVEKYAGAGFPGTVQREDLPEDAVCPELPGGYNDPNVLSNPDCIDQGRASRKDGINFYDRYAILEYRTRFADNKAGLTVKGWFSQFVRAFEPLVVLPPVKGLLPGGLTFQADFTAYRTGGMFDGDIELPGNFRLLYGGEAFYEWLPVNTVDSRQNPGVEARFWGPYNSDLLPLPCPRTATWDAASGEPTDVAYIEDCPLTFAFETDRTVFGGFLSGQWRPSKKLILDGGVRAQVAPEEMSKRGYDPVILGSGAIVYNFAENWHAKLNFAQGFRPPVFNNTDSNGEAVEFDGEANLKVERSAAFQAEVNARLLKGRRRIRELDLRLDYSYTTLENYIIISGGRYQNAAERGIHSAEALAKLYLKGDHRFEMGYTFLRVDTGDRGAWVANPEHWFNISGVMSLIPDRLQLHSIVRIYGAFEDPNRRVETRDLATDELGHSDLGNPMQTVRVEPNELVLDRIPPAAELQIGLRAFIPQWRTTITATAYNTLNARHYQPDSFHEYDPRLEFVPNPYEDFRFFASAIVNY